MSRVTSKLQVTIPRRIAEEFSIEPGDEIDWLPAGDTIRVVPPGRAVPQPDLEERLRLFDAASDRQRKRELERPYPPAAADRGWRREDLYRRGRPG